MRFSCFFLCLTAFLVIPVFSQNSNTFEKLKGKSPTAHEVRMLNIPVNPPGMQFKNNVVLTNDSGLNLLENYPLRPEYQFPGSETIYKLPKLGGELFFRVEDRVPDIEVDLFVLTDPNDAHSALLWLNGTGSIKYFKADPKLDYYLAVDGFEGNIATLQFSIQQAESNIEVCETSTTPIVLEDLLLNPYNAGGTWMRISGTGGDFDENAGTFTPAIGATTSIFMHTDTSCPSEEVIVAIRDCSIPALGHWGLILLGLLTMIIGIVSIRNIQVPVSS